MRSIAPLFLVALSIFLSTVEVAASPKPAYVCSFCIGFFGLVEQSAFQLHLLPKLEEKCGESALCKIAAKKLVLAVEQRVVPETLCAQLSLCTGDCQLYSAWPVDPLPAAPEAWPTQRRLAATTAAANEADAESVPLSVLKPVFESLLPAVPEEWGVWAHVALAMREALDWQSATPVAPSAEEGEAMGASADCDLQCKLQSVADHKPLQDHDRDRFSSAYARRLRGHDWRGVDCDDLREDVYPGRRTSSGAVLDAQSDHNCNGIFGRNATGYYEDLFCRDSQPRGIAILGDSATAHFHIPPQWITAQGWNLNQLLPDALNEMDFPHCSWGTGHANAEDCPLQRAVPGHAEKTVLSLYTQLRERNRCNHNDFQNIGVNGARITSSMQLVNALARDPANDHPLLVWLALIGNDVCNGHEGFSHMTEPDVFYAKAMETLSALDKTVPPNSHVVALALFDGELLFDTMHRHMHPLGTRYDALYDFLNCMEENPCWGWLNSNATVRRMTTAWSNNLNHVYQNISETQNFQNFKFIFYSPKWVEIFADYEKSGQPLTDLIEPADGFHPSQTGNALFAKHFFQFLEKEHPEAIGPVNPHNAEIDALFFAEK